MTKKWAIDVIIMFTNHAQISPWMEVEGIMHCLNACICFFLCIFVSLMMGSFMSVFWLFELP